MQKELNFPVEAMAAISELIARLNPGIEDIGVVVIAAKTGLPPALSGTIPPEQMHELFQWLIDHQDAVKVEEHDVPVETGTMN